MCLLVIFGSAKSYAFGRLDTHSGLGILHGPTGSKLLESAAKSLPLLSRNASRARRRSRLPISSPRANNQDDVPQYQTARSTGETGHVLWLDALLFQLGGVALVPSTPVSAPHYI